jgi:hypothetical protein
MPNFNDAGPQRSFDVIPDGTIVPVELTVKPGNAGEDGMLRRSKDGRSLGLDCEFTVTDGEHFKRKFWVLFTLEGATVKHAEAGDISRRKLRAILESAHGIRPDDKSEAANKARDVGYDAFNGLRFLVRVGVEPAQNGYKAKNTLDEVITPDKVTWRQLEQAPKAAAKPAASSTEAAPPAAIAKPDWAR